MQLSLQTKDQVVAAAAAAIQGAASAAGLTIEMASGSAMLAMVNAAAGVYLWLQFLAVMVLTAARLSTSSGADCDSFGADYGFTRLAGQASGGQAQVSRYVNTSAAYLPVGALIKTSDGSQSFAVIADSTNSAWQAPNATYPSGSYLAAAGTSTISVPVQNSIVGSSGNIIAGQLGLLATAVPGFDTVTNSAAFTNGTNGETDAAFKARFALWLPSLAKGTSIAVESAALSVQVGITCAVLNNTATIGGPFQPGYAVLAIDDGSGATPTATINTVAAAACAQNVIPLGAVISTVQATVVPATVVMTITCATSAIKAMTVPLVQAALASYIGALAVATVPLTGAPPNNLLPFNVLASIAFGASPNVLNVTGILLNGGTADIGGSPGTVVRVSSITVD